MTAGGGGGGDGGNGEGPYLKIIQTTQDQLIQTRDPTLIKSSLDTS